MKVIFLTVLLFLVVDPTTVYSQNSEPEDAVPAVISFVAPAYPQVARAQRMMGTTVSRVTVTKEGEVSKVQTVSAHPVFEKYVLDALKQWRFKPSTQEHAFSITCRFELRDEDCDESGNFETWISADLPRQVTIRTGAQCIRTTITEPGVYELADLFRYADAVALVRIVSGDTEHYTTPLYKAEIVKSFKGAAAGEMVYFGPYIGERLGWEYVLFLQNVPAPLAPKTASGVAYGTVRYAKVFNEGYSSMETSYKCLFDGESTGEQCDDGVRVCTDYIKLPKNIRTVPPPSEDTPFGCRWIRKTTFLSLLDSLQKTEK